MKSESLALPQKLQLKVDVETGKLIIKKSKDGSEDKFYSHKKSKTLTPTMLSSVSALTDDWSTAGGWGCISRQAYDTPMLGYPLPHPACGTPPPPPNSRAHLSGPLLPEAFPVHSASFL